MCCAVTTTASAPSRFYHSPRPSVELGKLYQNALQSYSYVPTYLMLQDWITGLFGSTYLLPLYIFIQSPAHFHCFPFEANLWFRRLLQQARTHQCSINSWCSMTMWHSTHIALKSQAAEFRCSRLQGLGNRCHLGLKGEERSFYCMVLFLHWLLVVLSSQPPDHVKHGQQANILLACTKHFWQRTQITVYNCCIYVHITHLYIH